MYLNDRFLFSIGNEVCRHVSDCIGNLSMRLLFPKLVYDKEQEVLQFKFYQVILDERSNFIFSLYYQIRILFATFFLVLLSLSFKSHFH